ncbi:MAG: hypothetical protein ACR2QM_21045, partial [Longimicrobiales bacterium]
EESVTYVPQVPGELVLPGAELHWWDVEVETMRVASLAPTIIRVVADEGVPPAIALPEDTVAANQNAPSAGSWPAAPAVRRWGGFVLLALLLGVVAKRRILPSAARLRSMTQSAAQRRRDSEGAHFKRFQRAARSGDPLETTRALAAWLDRWGGPGSSLASLGAEHGSALARELEALDGRLYGPGVTPAEPWSGVALAKAVARARARRATRPRGPTVALEPLPSLNPHE